MNRIAALEKIGILLTAGALLWLALAGSNTAALVLIALGILLMYVPELVGKAPAAGGEGVDEGFQTLAQRLAAENKELTAKVDELMGQHRSSEHYIDTLMDNVPANIYFKDRRSRFVRVNQSQANWLGLGHPRDLIGKTDHDFFDREHADQAVEDEQQIMETGKPIVGYVERETLPTGEEAWVLTTKMPFRDEDGEIIGTFGISNDVSELVRAQQTLERERNILRALIDSFPDHIYIKDSDGNFMV